MDKNLQALLYAAIGTLTLLIVLGIAGHIDLYC